MDSPPLLDSVRWFPDALPLQDVWEACQPDVARAKRAYREAIRALKHERDALAASPGVTPLRADQARRRAGRAPELRAQLARDVLALQKARDRAVEAALAPAHDAALGLGIGHINQALHTLSIQGHERCTVRCALGPNGFTPVGACDLLLPLPFLIYIGHAGRSAGCGHAAAPACLRQARL